MSAAARRPKQQISRRELEAFLRVAREETVEDRILELRRNIALLMMLSRAATESSDLGLGEKEWRAAWGGISDVCDYVMGHVCAIEAVLDEQGALVWAAPPFSREVE